MSEGEKKTTFKVVDRRRFTDDGDERTGPDVAKEPPARSAPPPASPSAASPSAASPSAAAPSGPSAAGAPAPKPKPTPPTASGLTFSMFLQSLAQQALMLMGLIPGPHGQRELALDQARETIDILEILKAKTAGNLDAEEQQLLDTVVYELKMSFVEVQQAIARSRAGKPGAPGMPR
jgi:hypothetical protein